MQIDWKKWKRQDFGDPGGVPKYRSEAEQQTAWDVQKPIQQLICDVHEEALNPNRSHDENLIGAIRRMVSMMGRVALEHERTGNLLVRLTWWIMVLTIAVAAFTVVVTLLTAYLIYLEHAHQ